MEVGRLQIILKHLQAKSASNIRFQLTAAKKTLTEPNEEFRYTCDNALLSLEQRQFYEDNGYIVIPKLVPDSLLDECRQRFVDICEGHYPKGQMILMKDVAYAKSVSSGISGEFLYNKLQDFVWDDVLSKYILLPELLDYVECFTGPNIMAMHTMLINKPPDAGRMTSKHPLHQDLHYFSFRPADRIVASWTAMERVTTANGCLCVIPGSHKGTLQPHEYPQWENGVNKAFHGVRGFDEHPQSALEMEKGDTVFFHPILIHGSGVNMTKVTKYLCSVTRPINNYQWHYQNCTAGQGCRKAISCHYAASECDYIDIRGTTQENIAEEVRAIAKRRGFEMDYKAFWQFRNRLARGKEINL